MRRFGDLGWISCALFCWALAGEPAGPGVKLQVKGEVAVDYPTILDRLRQQADRIDVVAARDAAQAELCERAPDLPGAGEQNNKAERAKIHRAEETRHRKEAAEYRAAFTKTEAEFKAKYPGGAAEYARRTLEAEVADLTARLKTAQDKLLILKKNQEAPTAGTAGK